MENHSNRLKITALIVAASLGAGPLAAQDAGWELDKTLERVAIGSGGMEVGGLESPGYNPNTLRPAGDGLGRHTATQDIDMGSNNITDVANIVGDGMTRIFGLAEPGTDSEAANKLYVDTKIAEALEEIESSLIDISVSIGDLLGGGDGGIDLGIGLGLGGLLGDLLGGDGSGGVDLDLGIDIIPSEIGSRITGLATPVDPDDAATKQYVDDAISDLISGSGTGPVLAGCDGAGRPGDACDNGLILIGFLGYESVPTYTTADDAGATFSFEDAEEYCADLTAQGFSDFRLPDADEFAVMARHRNRASFSGTYEYPKSYERAGLLGATTTVETSSYWVTVTSDPRDFAINVTSGHRNASSGENLVRCIRTEW